MSASDEIYGKVTRVLVQSLNVDESDLKPTASLQGDLGAESIDFLDIVFRLEASSASGSRAGSCSRNQCSRAIPTSCGMVG